MKLGASYSSFQYDDWLGSGMLCAKVFYVHIADLEKIVFDFWRKESWDFAQMCNPLSSSIRESIMQIKIHHIP